MARWTAVLGGVAAGALLAGCGGGDFAEGSAASILEAAEEDMQALDSVGLDGELREGEQEIGFDMSVSTDGDCEGTISVDQGTAEIRSVDGTAWMRPDEAFWDSFAGSSAALVKQLVGDKWVVVPAENESGDLTGFCDLDELLSDLGSDDGSDAGGAENEGVEDVDGTETVKVTGTTEDGEDSTVFVKVDEPHHIVRMEIDGDQSGTVTFSDFDADLDVEPPAEDDVVDLESLTGAG